MTRFPNPRPLPFQPINPVSCGEFSSSSRKIQLVVVAAELAKFRSAEASAEKELVRGLKERRGCTGRLSSSCSGASAITVLLFISVSASKCSSRKSKRSPSAALHSSKGVSSTPNSFARALSFAAGYFPFLAFALRRCRWQRCRARVRATYSRRCCSSASCLVAATCSS